MMASVKASTYLLIRVVRAGKDGGFQEIKFFEIKKPIGILISDSLEMIDKTARSLCARMGWTFVASGVEKEIEEPTPATQGVQVLEIDGHLIILIN